MDVADELDDAGDDDDEEECSVERDRDAPADCVRQLDGGVEAVGRSVARVDVDKRNVAVREVLQLALRRGIRETLSNGCRRRSSDVVDRGSDDDAENDVCGRGAGVGDDGEMRAKRGMVHLWECGLGCGLGLRGRVAVCVAVRGTIDCSKRECTASGTRCRDVCDSTARSEEGHCEDGTGRECGLVHVCHAFHALCRVWQRVRCVDTHTHVARLV